jgi:cellulose synthase/poly-beta-1,6-N-acetylglucosamine synthase-like glycosyltransferase
MDLIRILIYFSIFVGLFSISYYLLGFVFRKKNLKTLTKFPLVTVIIPAYNEEKTLEKTVESVLNLDYPKEKLEIIIVNDGSKDKTLEIAKSLSKENKIVNYIDKKNGGKASAMNAAIKVAKGEFVISFDADSMVVSSALKDMLPYFYDDKIMCVTPGLKVFRPKGILQRVQAIEYDLGLFLRKSFSKADAIHVTPGPFSIYRKVFFEKYGGYDEKNITEDMEIAMRIQSKNYRIENCPKAMVYTIAPKKFFPLLRQRRRWYFGMVRNLLGYKYMFNKKYGELGALIFPMALISTFTTMAITFYYVGRGIYDTVKEIRLYSLIGFDYFNNISYRWYSFALGFYRLLSEGIVIFGIFFILVTVTIILVANRKVSSIDSPISTFISYVFFIIFYSLFFSFWWAVSLVYAFTHKDIKW